jgi:hypothetical protein
MGFRTKWFVLVVVVAVLILVVTFLRLRSTAPIRDITWEAKLPHHLDITWGDDDEGHIYTIFWSDSPGIKIRRPETYKRSLQVSNFQKQTRNFARIYAPYEWVYFILTKEGFKSKEFEASTKSAVPFSCQNLHPVLKKRENGNGQIVIGVEVLGEVDSYLLQQYLADGSLEEMEFNVRGLKSIDLKFAVQPETLGYLVAKKSGEAVARDFLFYHENLSSGPDKWETVTRLC